MRAPPILAALALAVLLGGSGCGITFVVDRLAAWLGDDGDEEHAAEAKPDRAENADASSVAADERAANRDDAKASDAKASGEPEATAER